MHEKERSVKGRIVTMKRWFAILVSCLLVLCSIPATAAAEESATKIPFSQSVVDALIDMEDMLIAPGKNYSKHILFNNDTKNKYEITHLKVDHLTYNHVDDLDERSLKDIEDKLIDWIVVRLYEDNNIYFNGTFRELMDNQGQLLNYIIVPSGEKKNLQVEVALLEQATNEIQGTNMFFDLIIQAKEFQPPVVNPSKPSSSKKQANHRPVITLLGEEDITLYQGDDFKDQGATAYDKEDGDITSKIVRTINGVKGQLDTSMPGDYILEYNAKDSMGLSAKPVVRTLHILEVQKEESQLLGSKPLLTLIGEEEIRIPLGEKYQDEGATAYDELDGVITNAIVMRVNGVVNSQVNVERPGTYHITYDVKNSRGIEAQQIVRKVIVYQDEQIINISELPNTGQKIPIGYYTAGLCIVFFGVILLTGKKKNA